LAAYAIVAGGFGTKAVSPKWAECKPGRDSTPMLEIHGDEDRILPYLLNDWEPAKSRLAVPHWLEEWSKRNGCGEVASDPINGMDGTGTPVTVTKLEGGGWISEAEAYGGAVSRIAKSCPGANHDQVKAESPPSGAEPDTSKEEVKDKGKEYPEEEILETNPDHFTILHYRVKDFGHGWPAQQVKARRGEKKSQMFDATVLVLDWFKIHKLPGAEPVESSNTTATGKDEVEKAEGVEKAEYEQTASQADVENERDEL